MVENLTPEIAGVTEIHKENEVIEASNPKEYLGFREASPEDIEVNQKKFEDFWQAQISLEKDDFVGNLVNREIPEELKMPNVNILRRGEFTYYSVEFDDGSLMITGTEPRTITFGGGGEYTGVEVGHYLVPSDLEKNKYLDMTKIGQEKDITSFLTFSKDVAGGSTGTEYEVGPEEYVSSVFVSPEQKEEYDMTDYKYRYMHELAHAYLEERERVIERDRGSYSDAIVGRERDANALALKWTINIGKKFDTNGFLDAEEHVVWIENQLREGYDREDLAASNEARARNRQKPAAETKESVQLFSTEPIPIP